MCRVGEWVLGWRCLDPIDGYRTDMHCTGGWSGFNISRWLGLQLVLNQLLADSLSAFPAQAAAEAGPQLAEWSWIPGALVLAACVFWIARGPSGQPVTRENASARVKFLALFSLLGLALCVAAVLLLIHGILPRTLPAISLASASVLGAMFVAWRAFYK